MADLGAPDAAQVALRFTDLGGTLVAIGAIAVTLQVVGALGSMAVRIRRHVLVLGMLSAGVALLAAAGTPLLTARAQAGDGSVSVWVSDAIDTLVGSTWGALWLGRLLMLAVAVGAFALALGAVPRAPDTGGLGSPSPRSGANGASTAVPRATLVAGGALVVAAGIDGWAGHASTLPARSAIAAAAATGHILAAGVWAGALVVLVLTVVPLMRMGRAARRAVTPAAWRAFSPMAAVSTVVLAATGIYESGRHVETVDNVSRTLYGAAVGAKLLLLAVALCLAAYNTVLVNPGIAARVARVLRLGPGWRPRRRRLAATVTVESLVLGIAVVVAALMTSVPTAREVRAAQAVTAPHSETVDGLFVTFEAVPVGSRLRLVVRTEPVVRPQPAPPTGVDVRIAEGTVSTAAFDPGQRVSLSQTEPGRWEADSDGPPAGDWTAEVLVHRLGRPDTAVSVGQQSQPAGAIAPLEAVGTGLAATMVLGLVTGVAVVRRRRPPRPADRPFGAPDLVGAQPGPPYPPIGAAADPSLNPSFDEASTR